MMHGRNFRVFKCVRVLVFMLLHNQAYQAICNG
jgi:hypothetical protein